MKNKLRRAAVVLSLVAGCMFLAATTWAVRLANELCRLRELVRTGLRTEDERRPGPTLAELAALVSAEHGHFYTAGEMTPTRFGSLVADALQANGLQIESIRPGAGHTPAAQIEQCYRYEITGTALNLCRFLKVVSSQRKYWRLDPLHLSRDGGRMRGEFEIGFVTDEAER